MAASGGDEPVIEATSQPTPRRARSLFEIAALAVFVIFVPRLVEATYVTFGYATTGYNRIAATGLIFAGLAVFAAALVKWRGEPLAVAGLRWPSNSLKAIGLGVTSAAVIFALSLTVIPPNTTDITTELRNDPNLTLARMAFGFLVVGFVEEFVFRGVLFTRLEQIFAGGVWTLPLALLVQAVVFGFAHDYQGLDRVWATAGIGLFLGLIFVASGRTILTPFLAHGLYNAARAAWVFLVGT